MKLEPTPLVLFCFMTSDLRFQLLQKVFGALIIQSVELIEISQLGKRLFIGNGCLGFGNHLLSGLEPFYLPFHQGSVRMGTNREKILAFTRHCSTFNNAESFKKARIRTDARLTDAQRIHKLR